ncbi:MAG: FkbM family methyltransferase [Nostoc sp.]
MNQDLKKRPKLMNFRPLWLREKFFWKLFLTQADRFTSLFENATLELAPHISLNLMPTDISHKMIAFCGFYELPVSRCIVKLAKAGGLMIDVGANYGYYSCLWAANRPNNKVIAFEASPRNSSALKLNLMKNELITQVEVYEIALGKERGHLFFDLGPEEQSGWGGLLVDEQSDAIQVPVISLDEMFLKTDYLDIDVLKIDTEGADTWVLQGAEQLLRSHRIHHIFFEENTVRMAKLGIEPGEAQKMLKDCGYRQGKLI